MHDDDTAETTAKTTESKEGPRGPFGDEGPRGPSDDSDPRLRDLGHPDHDEDECGHPTIADDEDVPDDRPVPLVITPEKRAILRRRMMYFARRGTNVVVTSLHHDGQVMLSCGLVVHVAADFIVVLRVGTEGRSSKISITSVRDVRPVEATR